MNALEATLILWDALSEEHIPDANADCGACVKMAQVEPFVRTLKELIDTSNKMSDELTKEQQ
jgi:hypothetical protein